jgi:hypothetical protein
MTTQLLLPSTLHNKEIKQNGLTERQTLNNIKALSDFTDQRDVNYIYVVILRDDKVLFTSSSATPEERQSGENLSYYFDHYDDVAPRVLDIFKSKKKTFLEYTDQWDTFRSIFILSISSDGTFYIPVAHLSISHIQALLDKQIVNSIFTAFLFLLFAYPLYYTTKRKLKKDATRLNKKVQLQTLAIKDSQEKLVENQRVLLELAKENFIDKPTALTEIVYQTAKAPIITIDNQALVYQHFIPNRNSITRRIKTS